MLVFLQVSEGYRSSNSNLKASANKFTAILWALWFVWILPQGSLYMPTALRKQTNKQKNSWKKTKSTTSPRTNKQQQQQNLSLNNCPVLWDQRISPVGETMHCKGIGKKMGRHTLRAWEVLAKSLVPASCSIPKSSQAKLVDISLAQVQFECPVFLSKSQWGITSIMKSEAQRSHWPEILT